MYTDVNTLWIKTSGITSAVMKYMTRAGGDGESSGKAVADAYVI